MNEEANTTSGTDNLSGQSAPETAPSTEQAPEAQSAQTAPQQQPGVEGVPPAGSAPAYTPPVSTAVPLAQPAPMPVGPGAPVPPPASSGKAVAALVCGILAIVLSGSVIGGIGCGIAALVIGSKVLKQNREDKKAKAGRITGIIGLVFSALALVLYLVLGFAFFSSLSPVKSAVNAKMATMQNMSDADRQVFANAVDEDFSDTYGVSLSEIGIDKNELVTFALSDMSYEIKGVNVRNSLATVDVEVKSRDMDACFVKFYTDALTYLSSDAYNAATYDQAFAQLGTIMRNAMASTGMTTHDETLILSQTDGPGRWMQARS